MKLVFICSPLKGNVSRNLDNAKQYCEFAIKECGVLPIAPHLYFMQFLSDSINEERELGINAGLELLKLCSEVWVFGKSITKGMAREIEAAKQLGINIEYFDFGI